MDYAALRAELISDPLPLGYAGLDDVLAAAKLNATNTGRTRARTAVDPSEVFNAIDNGAWPSTAILQDKLRAVLGMPSVDASNANTIGILSAIFPTGGATGATRTRLLALANRTISRAEELNLGVVSPGDVTLARTQTGGW